MAPMSRFAIVAVASTLAAACGSDVGADDDPAASGAALYAEPVPDGNTFACATCHALSEPASDGLRRPGHPLAGALDRASFKGGELGELRLAVNSCLTEWMNAAPLASDSERWLSLEAFLAEQEGPADEIDVQIVAPPDELDGGDAAAGRDTYEETCIVCHARDGAGSERAPSLQGTTLGPARIAERVRLSGAPDSDVYDGLTGGIMPFWGADRLSDDELRDVIAYVLTLEEGDAPPDGGVPDGSGGAGERCAATHPSVGKEAELSTFAHDVAGVARIVDDCTIEIERFVYDGGGIDVRIYAGRGGDFDPPVGFALSEDLRGRVFERETLTVSLPSDRTLDDLDSISVWCVDVGVSFGDGEFE